MTIEADMSDVIYNAAEQAFEAVVTIATPQGNLRYAASFHAPIDTDFDVAAAGLVAAAERLHRLDRGMRAGAFRRIAALPQRAARPATGQWLSTLLARARAA